VNFHPTSGRLGILGSFVKITEIVKTNLGYFFQSIDHVLIFDYKLVGLRFGLFFFANSSGHPDNKPAAWQSANVSKAKSRSFEPTAFQFCDEAGVGHARHFINYFNSSQLRNSAKMHKPNQKEMNR
jgi:hypothetical protein